MNVKMYERTTIMNEVRKELEMKEGRREGWMEGRKVRMDRSMRMNE